MPESKGEVTLLLAQLREGNKDAVNQLVPLVYDELRKMAAAYMRREQAGHTVQATELVNEVYMRLAGGEGGQWQNRAHFFGIAANSMRQVLLDHARRRHAGKRGGAHAKKVELDAELQVGHDSLEEVLLVNDLLEKLEQIDPRQGRLVELRFFAGLTEEETAEAMNISLSTVKREWRSAKAWLNREMATGSSHA
jgi:RNA polymerase sigma factor (TIGR02999 family)